jgi:hypothetical protein
MGREGFEPSTLGLRADGGLFCRLGESSANRLIEPNQIKHFGVLWRRLVDFLLTFALATGTTQSFTDRAPAGSTPTALPAALPNSAKRRSSSFASIL